jgi:hypothetical protein
MWRRFVDLLTSLKLTIICLAAAMVLIFAGTLAQVHLGIHEAQQRYFQSFFVWWPPDRPDQEFPFSRAAISSGPSCSSISLRAHAKTIPLGLAETWYSSNTRRANHHAGGRSFH